MMGGRSAKSHKDTLALVGPMSGPGGRADITGQLAGTSNRQVARISGSNGSLLADFAQDLVEDTKRIPHFGPVALTMPIIVHRLALA